MQTKIPCFIGLLLIALLQGVAVPSSATPSWPHPEAWKSGIDPQWIRFRFDGKTPHGWGIIYRNGESRPGTWKRVVELFDDNPGNDTVPGAPLLGLVSYAVVVKGNEAPKSLMTECFLFKRGRWEFLEAYEAVIPLPLFDRQQFLNFTLMSETGTAFQEFARRHGARTIDSDLLPYWEMRRVEEGFWGIGELYPAAFPVSTPSNSGQSQ